jgi:hypothetical protein
VTLPWLDIDPIPKPADGLLTCIIQLSLVYLLLCCAHSQHLLINTITRNRPTFGGTHAHARTHVFVVQLVLHALDERLAAGDARYLFWLQRDNGFEYASASYIDVGGSMALPASQLTGNACYYSEAQVSWTLHSLAISLM